MTLRTKTPSKRYLTKESLLLWCLIQYIHTDVQRVALGLVELGGGGGGGGVGGGGGGGRYNFAESISLVSISLASMYTCMCTFTKISLTLHINTKSLS
jgi:hypothetical protein